MNQDRYFDVKNNRAYTIFTFISEGRYGRLTKILIFEELKRINNTVNLALGTVLDNQKIDFTGITNNGDKNKILATVAAIVYNFNEIYPDVGIYVSGSDTRRTILYQRAIAYAYDELTLTFNIHGDISTDDEIHDFQPFDGSKNYTGFLIERK